MRSVVMKDSTFKQCGICKEIGEWIEELVIDDVHFIYCHKCNTITFEENIDYTIQHKIEKIMNF